MSVNSVNNSNNNAGLYAGGAALLGAGAGAATGYLTKPFLKDGAPTDSFVKNVRAGTTEYLEKLVQEIDNLKNVDELKNFIKNSDTLKKADAVDLYLADVDVKGFEAVKGSLRNELTLAMGLNVMNEEATKNTFEMLWDKKANKFVDVADDVPKEILDVFKKAAKSIQGKYAMIYGAIGASVLGLGTLLCCAHKKQPEQPQNTDKQA